MLLNKKSFLKSEIARLANEGLINKGQEKAILDFYHLDENSDSPLLVIFAYLFIGLSILTFVAYNWQEIPNFAKTLLLLAMLFATHLGIFYCKNPFFKQGFGILSSFALLANLALLSQIYHLGENTALAFLSVGCVTLILALALKSFAVFIVGYLFTGVWCLLSLGWLGSEYSQSISLFICIIALGIVAQSGILFPISLSAKRILALLNFVFLGLYFYDFLGETNFNLSPFAWLSLAVLGFHLKPYKLYAYLTLTLFLLFESGGTESLLVSIPLPLLVLFVLLGIANLYFKHYLLGVLIIGLPLLSYYFDLYPIDTIAFKIAYSFATLLLGIHLIKEKHKFLGLFVFCLLALVRYLDLVGDYIGASILFLCFGLGLLWFARRENA